MLLFSAFRPSTALKAEPATRPRAAAVHDREAVCSDGSTQGVSNMGFRALLTGPTMDRHDPAFFRAGASRRHKGPSAGETRMGSAALFMHLSRSSLMVFSDCGAKCKDMRPCHE